MKAILCFLLVGILASKSSYAGFEEGLAAYEKGDYNTVDAEWGNPATLNKWESMAKKGDADAQYKFGMMLYVGGEDNRGRSEYWFIQAANQGHVQTQLKLCKLYQVEFANIFPDSPDYAQALKWCRAAASKGNSEAQYNLANVEYEWGYKYEHGKGVPQDYMQAKIWYQQAANDSNIEAQGQLGFMYYVGEGVPQSDKNAEKWYLKAANQDNAEAQIQLCKNFELEDYIKEQCRKRISTVVSNSQTTLAVLSKGRALR